MKGFDKKIWEYNKYRFQIKDINCDREFKYTMEEVKGELDVDMNYTARG